MKKIAYILLLILLNSCATPVLVNDWKNNDTPTYRSEKLLVVAMTPNQEIRNLLESTLLSELRKDNLTVVRSLDFFEKDFTITSLSPEEIAALEASLIENDFDSVLVVRLLGVDEKVTVVNVAPPFIPRRHNFRDYYLEYGNLYHSTSVESYKEFHTEARVYCLCPGEERELLWHAYINATEANSKKQGIKAYSKFLVGKLKKAGIVVPN